MTRYLKKEKNEIGLSPLELVFRGNKKIDQIQLRIIDFDEGNVEEKSLDDVKAIIPYQTKESVTWFNIDGLHDIDLLKEIGEIFNFETLILADILETNDRPKIEEYDNWVFVSIKMIQ